MLPYYGPTITTRIQTTAFYRQNCLMKHSKPQGHLEANDQNAHERAVANGGVTGYVSRISTAITEQVSMVETSPSINSAMPPAAHPTTI